MTQEERWLRILELKKEIALLREDARLKRLAGEDLVRQGRILYYKDEMTSSTDTQSWPSPITDSTKKKSKGEILIIEAESLEAEVQKKLFELNELDIKINVEIAEEIKTMTTQDNKKGE